MPLSFSDPREFWLSYLRLLCFAAGVLLVVAGVWALLGWGAAAILVGVAMVLITPRIEP